MAGNASRTRYNYLEVCIGDEGKHANEHWVGIRANTTAMPSLRSLRMFLTDFIREKHPGQTVTGFCMSCKHEIESDPSVTDLTGGRVFGGEPDVDLFPEKRIGR